MNNKIVVLSPYFSKLPEYFSVFLRTCALNTEVDFKFFITDENYLAHPVKYANIHFYHLSLPDFCRLATAQLGLEVCISSGYKVCDLRPAFGIIFSDYIREYAFWGCCDFDILFGRIRYFISDEVLSRYDIISSREEYISGSFFLMKNCDHINNLFRQSRDWKKAFQRDKHTGFDECNYAWAPLLEGQPIEQVVTEIDSFTHTVKREEKRGKVRVLFWTVVKEMKEEIHREVTAWRNGRLTDKKREYLFLHFVNVKHNFYFIFPKWGRVPETFFISRYGLYHYTDPESVLYALFTIRYLVLSKLYAKTIKWMSKKIDKRFVTISDQPV